MPRSLVWAIEQSLSNRVFAVRVSCMRAVLLISGVLWSFRFLVAAMEGLTLASAVCDVRRGVVKGCAGVADRDVDEVNPSPMASERGRQGVVLLVFFP